MNDLDELSVLEDELGDSLRRCLDGVLGAQHVNVDEVDLMGPTLDRSAVLVGVAARSVSRRQPLRWLLPPGFRSWWADVLSVSGV